MTDVSYDFYGEIKNTEVLPPIETTRKPEYSQELRNLVHDCLRFWPHERPSWSQLLKRVGRSRSKFKDYLEKLQRTPRRSKLRFTMEDLDEMEIGTWVKGLRAREDTPPLSYPSLEDYGFDNVPPEDGT